MNFIYPLDEYGPLCLRMPTDLVPNAGTDFRYALENHLFASHEDSTMDVLNEDGTWGDRSVGAESGSGIALGYSTNDPDAVLVAAEAVRRRKDFYNFEHWIRQIRYAIAAWEMTHDPRWTEEIIFYDNLARAALSDDPTTIGDVNSTNNIPFSLAHYHAMAQAKPHVALPWNLRAVGWIAYGYAMRLKVDPDCSHAWGHMLLDTCRLAAVPRTGQLCADAGNGAYNPPCQYTFQWGLAAHGLLACCYQMQEEVPHWLICGMLSIYKLPRLDYYGFESPVAFAYTLNGELVPLEGPQQHGDPGFGYWSSNCIALNKFFPGESWIRRAKWIGPQTANSMDERRASMLLRGALRR